MLTWTSFHPVYWTVQKLRCLNWSKPTLDSAVIKVPWLIPNCGRALDNYFLRQECGFRADAHFASQNMILVGNTLHCELLLKEQFASNLLLTFCSLTHFTPQLTLPTGIFFSLEHCSLTLFASYNPLLLSTLCFSAHFTPCP